MNPLDMSPLSWMAGATLVTLLCVVAAAAAERVAAHSGRVALRFVWGAAAIVALALIGRWSMVPASVPFSRAVVADWRSVVVNSVEPVRVEVGALEVMRARAATLAAALRVSAVPRWADQAALTLWLLASTVMLGTLLVSVRRLTRERASWDADTIAGSRVLIAPDFGPALVGVRRPEIIMPAWVRSLPSDAQVAIIAHEDEHRRSGDHYWLAAGRLLLVTMPWNVALWVLWRRFRLAIEFDCDARVVRRGVDRVAYSRVLLTACERTQRRRIPAPAFAERATGVGRRVEQLLRPRPRGAMTMRVFTGILVAAGCVAVACSMPRPDAVTAAGAGSKPGAAAMIDVGGSPLMVVDSVERPDLPPLMGVGASGQRTQPDSTALKSYPPSDSWAVVDVLKGDEAVRRYGERGRAGVAMIWTKAYVVRHPRAMPARGESRSIGRAVDPATPSATVAEQWASRNLAGITLDAATRHHALDLASTAFAETRVLAAGPIIATWPRIAERERTRDAAVRALLSTEADRAAFDANVQPNQQRMRDVTPTIESVWPTELDNAMAGITLSSRVRDRAVAIEKEALADEVALYERMPGDKAARDARHARRTQELLALLGADADRLRFRQNEEKRSATLRSLGR